MGRRREEAEQKYVCRVREIRSDVFMYIEYGSESRDCCMYELVQAGIFLNINIILQL